MRANQGRTTNPVRTIFVSDVHLGCRHSQAQAFLGFLERHQPEQLYIVGDFIDGWKLKRGWRWSPVYSQILQRLTDLAMLGTQVFYAPGNHDAFLRDDSFIKSLGGRFNFVEIADEFVFKSVQGQRLLVTHGDLFDSVESKAQWLSQLSTVFYDALLSTNRLLSRMRGDCDRSPYALCARLKHRVKTGIRFISGFEELLIERAEELGCSGVVCGHIHTPSIVPYGAMTYYNTGDWVENCTALVERCDGSLELEWHYRGDREQNARVTAQSDLFARSQNGQTASRPAVGLPVNGSVLKPA